MQKGQSEYAKRKALEVFDAWNDVTGLVTRFTSYYYELCAVIEDAVEIGSMVALDVSFTIRDGKPVETTIKSTELSESMKKRLFKENDE